MQEFLTKIPGEDKLFYSKLNLSAGLPVGFFGQKFNINSERLLNSNDLYRICKYSN